MKTTELADMSKRGGAMISQEKLKKKKKKNKEQRKTGIAIANGSYISNTL